MVDCSLFARIIIEMFLFLLSAWRLLFAPSSSPSLPRPLPTARRSPSKRHKIEIDRSALTELLQVLARPQKVNPNAVREPEPRLERRDRADDGEHREHAGPVRGRGHGLGVEHGGGSSGRGDAGGGEELEHEEE